MKRLWILTAILALAQFRPAAALTVSLESARGPLLHSIAERKQSFKTATTDPRFAELMTIEKGARQAGAVADLSLWQARFELWKQNHAFAPPPALPSAHDDLEKARLLRLTGLARQAEILQNLGNADFSRLFDGAKSQAAAAPILVASTGKKIKPPVVPPVAPLSNPQAVIEATAVLPRAGYRDRKKNARVTVTRAEQIEIAQIVIDEAGRRGVDPLFVLSFIAKESAFYAQAVGPFEEFGLMQLMPETAKNLARESPDIQELAHQSTHKLKKNANACKNLAKKLMASGKLVLSCDIAGPPPETTKKSLTAEYEVSAIDLYDPRTNIRLGVSYIEHNWNAFARDNFDALPSADPRKRADIKAVISAYNAGTPAVAKIFSKYGRPPRYTEDYVDSFINDFYLKLSLRFQKIAAVQPLKVSAPAV